MDSSKIYILWVRHCESCSNLVQENPKLFLKHPHQKFKQGMLTPPNCTINGIIQSFMYGYFFLPFLLKKYPKFKKIHFNASVLTRAYQTAKFISHGYQNSSGKKLKMNTEVNKLCNISETHNIVAKSKVFKETTSKTNEKSVSENTHEINKLYKNIGLPISNKVVGKSSDNDCYYPNYDKFLENVLKHLKTGLNLNLIISHGKYLKDLIGLQHIKKNLESCLLEYDPLTREYTILEKVIPTYGISIATSNTFKATYKLSKTNLKSVLTLDEFGIYFESCKFLKLDDKNNESPCSLSKKTKKKKKKRKTKRRTKRL
jgi:hypothetical protein